MSPWVTLCRDIPPSPIAFALCLWGGVVPAGSCGSRAARVLAESVEEVMAL